MEELELNKKSKGIKTKITKVIIKTMIIKRLDYQRITMNMMLLITQMIQMIIPPFQKLRKQMTLKICF